MKNILVPIGNSDNAKNTLQYAIDFAKQFDSNLFVMRSFSLKVPPGSLTNVDEKVSENTKSYLKEVVAKTDQKGVAVKIVTYNGDVVNGINGFDKNITVDLIIIASRSTDIKEEYYLGNTTGKIIKQTNIPTLIIPMGAVFAPFKNILTAFRSGILKRDRILNVLRIISEKFNSKINLLLVKTPKYTDEDLKINPALMDLSTSVIITRNTSTNQGVTEHFRKHNPDMLCVFRRKRFFLKKLWEKNRILKEEFFVPVPVLVLSIKKD